MAHERALAIITGASSGIGYEFAKLCAAEGYDLVIASDQAKIETVATELRSKGVNVESLQCDLANTDDVERLVTLVGVRPVDVLIANAGHSLGHAFLDQDWAKARHVVDTNITGTIYLVHAMGRRMRARGAGRILITGSQAGFIPGPFQAVYNGTKAFVNSFSFALREELRDSGVTVTCLMPGATETDVFVRAGMQDTLIAQTSKYDPALVASKGFHAMMAGDGDVAPGLQNKFITSVANVMPSGQLARMHRVLTEPGYKRRRQRNEMGLGSAFAIGACLFLTVAMVANRLAITTVEGAVKRPKQA